MLAVGQGSEIERETLAFPIGVDNSGDTATDIAPTRMPANPIPAKGTRKNPMANTATPVVGVPINRMATESLVNHELAVPVGIGGKHPIGQVLQGTVPLDPAATAAKTVSPESLPAHTEKADAMGIPAQDIMDLARMNLVIMAQAIMGPEAMSMATTDISL